MTLSDSVQLLFAAYPFREGKVSEMTIRVYLQDLADLPLDDVVDAMNRLRRTSKWLPSVAEIREVVAEDACGLPTEDEAWSLIRACLAKPHGEAWNLPDGVSRVMRLIGTSFDFRSDDKGVMQTRFRKAYAEERRKMVQQVQSGQVRVSALPGREVPAIEEGTR